MRDEAERLVAAALGMVMRGLGSAARPGSGFATGSPECCVCPVCRAIAAIRDAAPREADLADRVASGVGDLATTVGTLLRNLTGGRPEPELHEAGVDVNYSYEDGTAPGATASCAGSSPSDRSRLMPRPRRA